MKKSREPSFVDALARVSHADLEEIDRQIVEKQQALEDVTRVLDQELDALRLARKVIDVKLHGKPKKTWSRRGKQAAGDEAEGEQVTNSEPEEPADEPKSLADRIQEVIELRGPMTTSRIAQYLCKSEQAVRISIGRNPGRFEINDDDEWVVKEQE